MARASAATVVLMGACLIPKVGTLFIRSLLSWAAEPSPLTPLTLSKRTAADVCNSQERL